MNDAKFTKGLRVEPGAEFYSVCDADDSITAIVSSRYPEALADAHLYAAAPEMYAALEDILAGWRYIRENHGDLYGVGWDRAEQNAMQALSKARGEV